MDKKGNVYKYKKNRGYESLSREMLQDKSLSWGARGLLAYMVSLPDEAEIKKTGLYDLCPDKKKATERLWDELVVFGYIIQFRKATRNGVDYIYLFSSERFSEEEIEEKESEMNPSGYTFYLNKQQLKKIEEFKNEIKKEYEEWNNKQIESNKIDSTSAYVQNEQVGIDLAKVRNEQVAKEPYVPNEQTATHSDSQHMFEANSSEGSTNIFKYMSLGLSDEEEDYIFNLKGVKSSEKIKAVGKYLLESGIQVDDMISITNALHTEPELLDFELIQAQLEWCIEVANSQGISDIVKYFLNGLRIKVNNKNIRQSPDAANKLNSFFSDSENESDEIIPFFNWLD